MAVNISEVRLLAVPLQDDYKNTAYFASASAQTTYFTGKTKLSTTNVSYIKDNEFTYPADYDDLQKVNYVMYKNSAYTNKWFYAFIVGKERLNDGATKVKIKTDSFQTYLFDYNIGYCFVEREHVSDDTAGAHTIPENLETGEYICDEKTMNDDLSDTSIIVASTLDLNSYSHANNSMWNMTKEYAAKYGDEYDGLYSGLSYYVMTPSQLKTTLKNVAYEGQEEAIIAIFMAPTNMLTQGAAGTYGIIELAASSNPKSMNWECTTKPTTLDGYTPKNNKLLTSPYCYLLMDNGGGGATPYQYEKFNQLDSNKVTFKISSTVSPGMSVRAIPLYYNGVYANDSEGINLAKYAQCSWTTDAYTSWLAKNGANVAISTGVGVASAVLGALAAPVTGGGSLAVAGAIVGGVGTVASNVATVAQHAQVPPQAHGNTNSGDVQTARGAITFTAYKMSIKAEYARIIDNYFTMYGYKVNSFKVPNKNHRQYFWYTKTVDAIVTGDIPQEDLQTIKSCYDKGITFWKNPDNIGMTVTSNNII